MNENMNIEYIDVDKVKPYPNNPRVNDDAVESTAESIKQFGWQQAIVVDKNMVIIAGHTRLKAAKKLGYKKVPIKIADLSDEKAKAYRLADNKVAEASVWDTKKLMKELDELTDIDMNKFGFELEPDFEPGDIDDQGDLTETEDKETRTVKCPNCGEEFEIDA